ncbi:MAG: LysR family transcriptional regulator [Burkholderiaceae bacterium]|nr:LysR family transcriptional regulator [Burkholderiaceae bacterium]
MSASSSRNGGELLDPRKLLYLAAAIEHGSFTRAAKHLGITQPALSTSIERLESSMGSKLLERSAQGVTPTRLGELLHFHARLIRDELEVAEKRLRHSDQRDTSTITFGTLPSLATAVVPTGVSRWRQETKGILLRIVEDNQLGLLFKLLRGELDFIVAKTEFFGFLDGMRQRVLFRDQLHVIARQGHPALSLKAPTWSELAGFPWVTQMFGAHKSIIDDLMAATDVHADEVTECKSVACIKALVSGSDSLAVLPASAVAEDVISSKLALVNISAPQFNRDIAVMFRENVQLSDAERALIANIERAGREGLVPPLETASGDVAVSTAGEFGASAGPLARTF